MFEPGPSAGLAWVLAVLHLAAVVAVVVTPWHAALRLAVAVLLAASCSYAVRVHAWRRGPRAWSRLERLGKGRWRLTRNDGTSVTGQLHADSFVHRWLVVAGLGSRPFVAIPVDALTGPAHRRLRVWMRWGNC